MSDQQFQELSRRMFELYRREEYLKAYEAITREADSFSEWAGRMQYWRICLATRMGEIDLALQIFEEATEAGHWFWKTSLREDPDLEPLQGLPKFEQLVDVSSGRQEDARAAAVPDALIFEPESAAQDPHHPLPLLIALHGNNSSAEASSSYWRPATSKGWLLLLPQSTQVGGPDSFVWNDRDWTEGDIRYHYASVIERYQIDVHRTVLAGFSMGARWSIWLALSGSVPVTGFVAVAPFLPDMERFAELIDTTKDRDLRGYFIVGGQDAESAESTSKLAALMQSIGFSCEVEYHPELGHAYPAEFHVTLQRALDFLSSGPAIGSSA